MGLREKVALAAVAVIASRILCSCCMPRVNYSLKNDPGRLKTANKDHKNREIKINERFKKNSLNSIIAVNESTKLRFPEVEYPSSSQVWDYYRFQNDYTNDLKSKVNNDIAVNSPQTRNFERVAKHKRKYELIANTVASPVTPCNDLEYDPAPQPYCFRKSAFFPELDYPLSARDMWIPTYWNRHMDTERDGDRKIFDTITRIKKPSVKYDTSLNCIINTVNANNEMLTKSSDEKLMSLKTVTTNNISPTTQTSILENCESVDILKVLSTPVEAEQTTTEPHLILGMTTQSYPDGQQDLALTNDTSSVPTVGEIYLHHLTTETLPVTLPMTISSETCIINNNLFTPPYVGTTEPMNLDEILENNTSLTVPEFTYFDLSYCITASPLECLTPPLTNLDKAVDEYNFSLFEKTTFTTRAPATTSVPESIILSTTISPNQSIGSITSDETLDKDPADEMPNIESTTSVITDASYKSPSDDIVLICTDNPKNSSVICLDGLNENWVFSSNDSYITWESLPEHADDWIIFVDTKNNNIENGEDSKTIEQVLNSENPVILCVDHITTNKTSSSLDSLGSDFGSPSFIPIRDKLFIVNDMDNMFKIDENKTILNFLIQERIADADQLSLPIMNSTEDTITSDLEPNPALQYSDDKCASCTDSPDDSLVACPDYANGA